MYPSYLEYFRATDSISLVDFDYDRNLFEFEQNSALPVLKGRLRSCLSYWHTIGANSFVIDTIKFGYRIPFISTPCQARFCLAIRTLATSPAGLLLWALMID